MITRTFPGFMIGMDFVSIPRTKPIPITLAAGVGPREAGVWRVG